MNVTALTKINHVIGFVIVKPFLNGVIVKPWLICGFIQSKTMVIFRIGDSSWKHQRQSLRVYSGIHHSKPRHKSGCTRSTNVRFSVVRNWLNLLHRLGPVAILIVEPWELNQPQYKQSSKISTGLLICTIA